MGLAGIMTINASASLNLNSRKSDSKRSAKTEIAKARGKVKKIAKANENALIWLPGHRTNFWWDEWSDNPGWMEGSSFEYTYYDNGLLKSEEDEYQLRVYDYDDLGRLVKEEYYSYGSNFETGEQNTEMELSSVCTYEYDSIVKDFVILETEKSVWSDWKPNIYGTDITRNDEGNVTLVRDFHINENGEEFYYSEEFVVKYGSDGKACEVYYIDTVDNEYSDHLIDIEWENTDGQILGVEFDDYNSDSFFGANRIKSATFVDEVLGTIQLNMKYEGESFSGEVIYLGEVESSFDYQVLDSYGSYICNGSGSEYDYDEDTNEITLVAHEYNTIGETYDSCGLLIEDIYESEIHYLDGEIEKYKEGGKATVAYDQTYGYPLEYIFAWYDEETGSYVYSTRDVYSDYRPFESNSVESIGTADTEAEYFTLQGVKVANPAQGIYIVRRGNKTFKSVIR